MGELGGVEGRSKFSGRGGFSGSLLLFTLAEIPCSLRSLVKLPVLFNLESNPLLKYSPTLSRQDKAGEFPNVLVEEVLPLPKDDGVYIELGVT